MSLSRRSFIKATSATALLASPIVSSAAHLFEFANQNPLHISIFSKHLQFLDYEDMCDAVKEMGFDGIDLTVRPNGHVLPENVEEDLPKATAAMKKVNMQPLMITTSVKDSANPTDKKVLTTAAELGYKYYRPAWYKYGNNDNIQELANRYSQALIELGELSQSLGIAGSYQNRSGHYFGAPVWDLNAALEQIDIKGMGNQYDIMHNVIEGGLSWELDFRLIKEKINTLVIKDFKWAYKNGVWDKEYVPMGEGMVDFKHFFKLLKQYKINVPMSIHCEHVPEVSEKEGKSSTVNKEVYKIIKKDLDYVRDLWQQTN